jgi:photosystem II stability/assembly factor-like uncharacterized protein
VRATHRILIAFTVFGLLAALPAGFASAGDGVWTTLNTTPYGPLVLAIDPGAPGNVYAIGPQETLLSRDGGGEWSRAGDVPQGTSQLVFDPLTPSILYAVVNGSLQRRIGDSAWTVLALGLLKGITSLAINPDNPNQLWAVTAPDLLRSEDGGVSWTRNALPAPASVTALAIGLPDSLHVYVALAGQGFFHSADGGATWKQAGAGLEGAGKVYGLQADGSTAGTLYLASQAGLRRSTDYGASWTRLETPQPFYGSGALLWTAADGGSLYTAAGDVVYRSKDKGATWQTTRPAGGWTLSRLVAEPGNPAVMYAIADGAVLKSFDAGVNWTQPPVLGRYTVVAAHPTSSGLLLANSIDRGAWRSADGGRTWAPLQAGWPVGTGIGAFHMHAGDPNRMFAAAGNLLLASQDAGLSWTATGMPTADTPRAITTARGDPALLLVSLGRIILRSSDGGAFWQAVQLPGGAQANDLWISPEESTLVLAATTQGVFRSTDGGASWRPTGGVGQIDCLSLWSGAVTGEVVANTEDGLVASSDSGANWSSSPPGAGLAGGAHRILRDWNDATVLYALRGDRVLISPNGGLNWLPVGEALAFAPASLAVDSMAPRQLYAQEGEGRSQWRLTLPQIPAPPAAVLTTTAPIAPSNPSTLQPEALGTPLAPTAEVPALVQTAVPTPAGSSQADGNHWPGTWLPALGGIAVVSVLGVGGFLIARRRSRSTARKEE